MVIYYSLSVFLVITSTRKILERWRVVVSSEPCICPHRDQVILRVHTRLLFATCLFVKQLFPSSACFKIRMDPSWVNINEIHCNDAVKFLFLPHRNSSKSSTCPDSLLINDTTYSTVIFIASHIFLYIILYIISQKVQRRDSKMALVFIGAVNVDHLATAVVEFVKKTHTTWLVTVRRLLCWDLYFSLYLPYAGNITREFSLIRIAPNQGLDTGWTTTQSWKKSLLRAHDVIVLSTSIKHNDK